MCHDNNFPGICGFEKRLEIVAETDRISIKMLPFTRSELSLKVSP